MNNILTTTKEFIHTTNNVIKYDFLNHTNNTNNLYEAILKDVNLSNRSTHEKVKDILLNDVIHQNLFD